MIPSMRPSKPRPRSFFGAETALYFGGGFIANYAIFSTLPQRGDLIVYDELIHASVHDGMRASKAEQRRRAPQRCQAFDDAIMSVARSGRQAGGRGSPSRASTPWTATRRRSMSWRNIADRHGGDARNRRGARDWRARPRWPRASARISKGAAMSLSLHTCGKAWGDGRAGAGARGDARFSRQSLPALHLCHCAVAADGRVRAAALRLVPRQPERRDALAHSSRLAVARVDGQDRASGLRLADHSRHRRARCARHGSRRGHAGARLRHPRRAPADGAGRHRARAHLDHVECERARRSAR